MSSGTSLSSDTHVKTFLNMFSLDRSDRPWLGVFVGQSIYSTEFSLQNSTSTSWLLRYCKKASNKNILWIVKSTWHLKQWLIILYLKWRATKQLTSHWESILNIYVTPQLFKATLSIFSWSCHVMSVCPPQWDDPLHVT